MIERHFETLQPRPNPRLGGATPGARLLEQRQIRTAKLQSRVRASLAAHPEASEGTATAPGIQLRPTLPSGALPTSVVTGDFNRDGHMDFVVANGIDNDLWIYFGNGDGTFQLPRVIPLTKGLSPVGLAVGNFRGNGKLDLVVAEADTATIGILLGNGDGTFGIEQEFALPEPPESVVVDDFNHDGKADIAAVMVTTIDPGTLGVPYLALLTGDGSGNFAAPAITNNWGFYSTAWNLASGDVNGDGLPDLLITGPGIENSQIYLNNGDGTFKAGATVIENGDYTSLLDGRLADVNGDGCLDAVVADAGSPVWVALGDCSGNFGAANFVMMGDSNAAVRIADVNGDGHPDIVTSSLPAVDPSLGFVGGNTLSVALGDGKGNFGAPRNYVGTSQAYSIGIADFNGDGKPDFVTANNDTDTMTVYQNDGGGSFGFPQGVYAGVPGQGVWDSPFSSLSFADLNNDGKMDAFLVDEGYSGEYYATSFLNDGTGRFTGPISSDTGTSILSNWLSDYRLGDFRNTGKLDLVGIGQDTAFSESVQFIFFSRGNGDGTFAKGSLVTATNADGILTTGDFNHDGKLDFVTINGQGTHILTTFLGNGDGTFRALAPVTFADSTQEYASRAYTGDFNRDGKLDVLIFTTSNGYWTIGSAVWEFDGNGDGTFQPGRQLFTGFQPFEMGDVNGDGHPDIARYDFMWPGTDETLGPARFTTYLGQADGSFSQSSSYAPYAGIPLSIAPFLEDGDPAGSSLVADLNGDGKPDEVAFQSVGQGATEKYAQVLMGNGDGTFTPTYDIFPFYILEHPLYAYDLDGDGKADMVQVVGGTSSLQVYKGAPAPALQIALTDEVVKGNASCGWVFPNLASNSSTTVTLSSSVPGVVLPASVTVPANATGAQFCYTLVSNFDWRQVFDINAQLNGDTATAYASDSYVYGFSVGIAPVTPAALYSGQSTDPATVSVTSSQGYSSTVNLYCEGMSPGDSCQFSSNTLAISGAGPATTTVTFVLATDAVNHGNTHSFTVAADDGNVIQRQTATVNVSPLYMDSFTGPIQTGVPGTASFYINLTGIAPYTLSCSGLPPGATCSFANTQTSFPDSASIATTVTIPAGTAAGSYPLQFTVNSGPLSASQPATLQVVSFSVQGPPAGYDWVLVGAGRDTSITASSGVATGQAFTVTCTLDVGGTCNSFPIQTSTTPQTGNLDVSVPSGTPTGKHVLTVTTTLNSVSQSFTFPFYVSDYSGSISPSYVSFARTGTGTLTATLNATTDFSGAITLSCTGTAEITCTFNPATVQLTGGTPQTVAVMLTPSIYASAPPVPGPFTSRRLLALAALFPLGVFWGLRRRRWSALLMILAGFVLLLPVTSCGSGGGSGSGGAGGGGGGSNSYSLSFTALMANNNATRPLGSVSVTVTH